jgi:threonine synthase
MVFVCTHCGEKYSLQEHPFRCRCGGPFALEKETAFPISDIEKRKPTMWRYWEALPIEDTGNIVSFGEGMTPLVPWRYKEFNLFAKVETLSHTGSFKDRGAAVLVSFLKELGVKSVVEDSSGNAGAALAAYAAKGQVECEIFCPGYASQGKLVQIALCGARLRKIPGTREDTSRAVMEQAERVYYASHNWNPVFLEGLKTMAFEMVEQLGWRAPSAVICPLGFGGLLISIFMGFREMAEHGVIEKMPRLLGVQPEACCPVEKAFRAGSDGIEKFEFPKPTLAEGACAAHPHRWKEVLHALKESGGAVTAVSEKEIVEGIRALAGQGYFVEPTSAMVVKGIEHFYDEGILSKEEEAVAVLTGTGLKAISELVQLID